MEHQHHCAERSAEKPKAKAFQPFVSSIKEQKSAHSTVAAAGEEIEEPVPGSRHPLTSLALIIKIKVAFLFSSRLFSFQLHKSGASNTTCISHTGSDFWSLSFHHLAVKYSSTISHTQLLLFILWSVEFCTERLYSVNEDVNLILDEKQSLGYSMAGSE